jgi:hypothetical protein
MLREVQTLQGRRHGRNDAEQHERRQQAQHEWERETNRQRPRRRLGLAAPIVAGVGRQPRQRGYEW